MRNLRTPFRLFPDCWHSNTTALVLWVAGHNAGRHHNHPSCSLCCGADRPRVGTFLPRSASHNRLRVLINLHEGGADRYEVHLLIRPARSGDKERRAE
eukprot:s1120_g9.t2